MKKLGMHEVISFLPPIQVGYEIYYENLEIEGIRDRQTTAWQFIQGSNQLLDWEQEPSNPQNPHAIKILGISEQMFSTKHEMLGYVPADVAKQIVSSGLWPFMQLRLDCIYAAEQGSIAIRFQILGPIRKKTYQEKITDKHPIEEKHISFKAINSGLLPGTRAEDPDRHRSIFKKVGVFVFRMIILLFGMGLAFVGGKMGTAAWQADANFFSILMLFPAILVMSGGVLIWAGIRPSKPTELTAP